MASKTTDFVTTSGLTPEINSNAGKIRTHEINFAYVFTTEV